MKKVLTMCAMAALLAAGVLVGCGGQSNSAASSAAASAESAAASAEAAASSAEAAAASEASEVAAEASAAAESAAADAAAAGGAYADGTYTGTGEGKGGPITVTLTISGGVISVDSIVGDDETEGIGGYEAIQDGTFASQIEAAQGGEIDGVTGATLTSDGVRQAVADALSQAA